MRFFVGIGFLLGLAGLPAFGQERPMHLPTRDVAVNYRVLGRAARQVQAIQVRFLAARHQLRVEPDDRGMGFLLVDPTALTARMVVPAAHHFIDLPIGRDRRATLLLSDGLDYARRGRARVAGYECTLWDVRGGADTATACITADGVLLRAQGKTGDMAGSELQATKVDYAAQPVAMFQVPADFRALDLPDLLGPLLRRAR
jgi:hypothetical protein